MTETSSNRFDIFYQDRIYLEFKNRLYNYRLRKKAIQKNFQTKLSEITLEIGSGISPILGPEHHALYSDLSFDAMKYLKWQSNIEDVLCASVTNIPFKDHSISTIVCSEVMEHVPDDVAGFSELSRVMKSGGDLILTVPVHGYFYTFDDAYVHHVRRYEIQEVISKAREAGFELLKKEKVMGLLDKAAMLCFSLAFGLISKLRSLKPSPGDRRSVSHGLLALGLPLYTVLNVVYGWIAGLEALVFPESLSTVMLFHFKRR